MVCETLLVVRNRFFYILKVDQNTGLIDERSRAQRVKVLRGQFDKLLKNLFTAHLLATMLSSVVIRLISCECGVFVLCSLRSTTALVIAWAVISAHDGEGLGTRYRLPSKP